MLFRKRKEPLLIPALKIGIDCRLWNETGVGRYIRNLVFNLAKIDGKNDYYLFLPKDVYQQLNPPVANFKKVQCDIPWHSVQEQFSFAKLLYQSRLDLVHFPYISFPVTYLKPFVLTIHDLIPYHFQTGKASALPEWLYNTKFKGYKFLTQQGAKHARKIITVSQASKKDIVRLLHVPEEKVVVTYEGIDTSLMHRPHSMNITVEKMSLETEQSHNPYFLYVGNAYPHKNVERLFAAFTKVVHEIPNIKLVMIGREDFFYTQLHALRLKLGLELNVEFRHHVSDEELSELYLHALGLVVPSLMEGFGLSALEAMANKCLVLASNIPALTEICADGAIYFDPTNIDELAALLRNVYISPKDFFLYHERGFLRSQQFSWEKMAEQTLAVYESSTRIRPR